MSNELISVRAWIEKHSFDQKDSFNFLAGKTLDGTIIRSISTKVSETALDSYTNDVRAAQKRKPPNKGQKKIKAGSEEQKNSGTSNARLKKIDKPADPAKTTPKSKLNEKSEHAPKAAEKKPEIKEAQIEAKQEAVKNIVSKAAHLDVKETSEQNVIPEQVQESKNTATEHVKKTETKPAVEPKKQAAFTANVSKVVDPAVLARIQKSQQEKAMRGNQGQRGNKGNRGAHKSASATGYSGNLRAQPRQTENKAQAGGPQIRRPGFGTTLQDVLSANTPAHKDFLDNRTHSNTRSHGDSHGNKGQGRNKKGRDSQRDREIQKENAEKAQKRVDSVLVSLSKTPIKKVYTKDKVLAEGEEPLKIIHVSKFTSIGELAGLLGIAPARVIGKCMEMNKMVTINHKLDFDTVEYIAYEFGFEAQLMEGYKDSVLGIQEDSEENLKTRHPIVTVMGHVDHGKTSLLDYIRKTNVARGEFGGITQHISSYEVETPAGKITFLDTPGHEAFTAMRARGSKVADVIVLVVAADAMVTQQTIESIALAKEVKVPIVVAITKMDLPTANPEKILSQLSERGVQAEEWGGNVSCVKVSVKTGEGISKLLETLALESEVLDLKAVSDSRAKGFVVESRLDAGKGTIATILIQKGTLKVRDCFVCGNYSGRVRALFNDRGDVIKEAGPSTPCQVLGFTGTPQAGDELVVVESDQMASKIASERQQVANEIALRLRHISLEQVHEDVKSGKITELNLIIKADVAGSCEALEHSLEQLANNEVKIKIIHKGVGAVNETDVRLAAHSNSIIIAFNLIPSNTIRRAAEQENIEIRTYRVIYDFVEEIKGAIEGLLKPVVKEEQTAEAEILSVFKIPKIGLIAGCMVKSGEIDRESQVRVCRDGIVLGVTRVQSLKRQKEDVSSVRAGFECGIGLKGYENIKEGDSLMFFKQVNVTRTLADVTKESK